MNIFKGRINRKQYLIGIVYLLLFILIGGSALSIFLILIIDLVLQDTSTSTAISALILSYLIVYPLMFLLVVKRMKDLGWNVWPTIIVLNIISVIVFYLQFQIGIFLLKIFGILISIALFFGKGDEDENIYGPNPKDKSTLEAIFNLKKKEKIVTDLAKIEKESSKINSKNILIWIGVLSGLIALSSIIYYFIYLPTVTKNERITCIDNANKIPYSSRREREIEICTLKYK
jgi:uncharacterized membrane protein YhaH (DUF805 family)